MQRQKKMAERIRTIGERKPKLRFPPATCMHAVCGYHICSAACQYTILSSNASTRTWNLWSWNFLLTLWSGFCGNLTILAHTLYCPISNQISQPVSTWLMRKPISITRRLCLNVRSRFELRMMHMGMRCIWKGAASLFATRNYNDSTRTIQDIYTYCTCVYQESRRSRAPLLACVHKRALASQWRAHLFKCVLLRLFIGVNLGWDEQILFGAYECMRSRRSCACVEFSHKTMSSASQYAMVKRTLNQVRCQDHTPFCKMPPSSSTSNVMVDLLPPMPYLIKCCVWRAIR